MGLLRVEDAWCKCMKSWDWICRDPDENLGERYCVVELLVFRDGNLEGVCGNYSWCSCGGTRGVGPCSAPLPFFWKRRYQALGGLFQR